MKAVENVHMQIACLRATECVSLGGSTERFLKGVGYFWGHLGKLHKLSLAPYLSLLSFLVEMLQIYMKTEFCHEPAVQLP